MKTYRPYRIEFGVTPAIGNDGGTEALLDFLMGLPMESALKQHICVEPSHSEKYPRPIMRFHMGKDVVRPVSPTPERVEYRRFPVWTFLSTVSFTDKETAEELIAKFAAELEPAGWLLTSPI